jgi:two-component system sensor histidine kinase/response regulator
MTESRDLVLIIDDEETIRDSCAQILAKSHYAVETAENGKAGLQKIRDLRPDAVIVDLKMPGMSGFDVLENLRVIDPQIMAIVITGYATVDSAVEAMKKGAYDFLPKPFTPEELRIILARALEHRRLALEAEALRREKEILEANMITMVSHQLRSPLVAIQQYFEVLLAGMAGSLEEKSKEMIKKASDRLVRLLDLINDWLDLARIDSGRLVGKLKPIDLHPVLSKLVEFMVPLAREFDVAISWDAPEGPLSAVLGDDETLEQVFANLISNAIKYNKPHGRVSVRIGEERDFVVVDVQDTGIGIAEKDIPRIFDQFVQISRRADKMLKGSGLGLSIAKKIIDAHGGRIDVKSEPGSGSTFSVRLRKVPADTIPT